MEALHAIVAVNVIAAVIAIGLNAKLTARSLKNSEREQDLLAYFKNNLKITFKNTTLAKLIIAAASPILLTLLLVNAFNVTIESSEPFWFLFTISLFVSPIWEEYVFRGVLMTSTLFLFEKIKSPRILNVLIALALSAAVFVLAHGKHFNTLNISISLVFGLLYLLNDKNLLYPIIGHSAYNLLILSYVA